MPINYKQYPYNWKTTIRTCITERSGNKCESCGLTNHSTVWSIPIKAIKNGKKVTRRRWTTIKPDIDIPGMKQVKVILTVAHKNHDRANNNLSMLDLIHECQRCHLKRDAYMKARRRACAKWCIYPNCTLKTCSQYLPG